MSVHPLAGDLSVLTADELSKKHADLTKKLSMAYRMNMGDAISQLNLLLQDYQYEIRLRQEKMMAEIAEKSAEFKSIIDIK